jgi:hypothetical protein
MIDELHDELSRRWLCACGVDRGCGQRLIDRHEIVENL